MNNYVLKSLENGEDIVPLVMKLEDPTTTFKVNHVLVDLTEEEQKNMQVIGILAERSGKYIAKEITADQFAKELSNYMNEDIVFWSNYNPTNESLKPLFAQRNGISEILTRYDYEDKHEKIKEGTGLPSDFSIKEM